MKRKIAAILAADVAEYSRLVAEDEERTLRDLFASVAVFRASVETHGGRIFNTAGDAVLAEFQSAVEAVRSAIDIQTTLRARSQDTAPNKRVMFRMGISIGDVVENEGDLLGDGVNIAARLQGLAEPGGLAISRWVQEQVSGKVGAEFRDAGHQHVRNIPQPIHVFKSSIGAPVPAPVPKAKKALKARPAAEGPRSARQWQYGALAAGVVLMAMVAAYLAFTLYEASPVAVHEPPPPVTSPAAPDVAKQGPEQPDQREAALPPAETPPPTEPAATAPTLSPPVETAAPAMVPPPAAVPPGPAVPAAIELPGAPAPTPSLEANFPPVTPPATANAQPEQPAPAAAPPPRQETLTERKRTRVQCAEVMERAQLGELTSDDQAFLRSKCR